MKLTETPKSSNLRGYAYRKSDGRLLVCFKGQGGGNEGGYIYKDVPPSVVAGFESASSVGRYFIANVRDKFQTEKVTTDQVTYFLDWGELSNVAREKRVIKGFANVSTKTFPISRLI